MNSSPLAEDCMTFFKVKFIQLSQLINSPFNVSPFFNSIIMALDLAEVNKYKGN